MKTDPFGSGPVAKEKSTSPMAGKPKLSAKPVKEESMEDKLAQLKNKFNK